jgi:hypothetical protein
MTSMDVYLSGSLVVAYPQISDGQFWPASSGCGDGCADVCIDPLIHYRAPTMLPTSRRPLM